MNSWLQVSDSQICWRCSFWNSLIWSNNLFWISFNPRFPLILFYRDLCWGFIRTRVKIVFFETSFRPWIKTIYDFNRTLNFRKNNGRNITTIRSSNFSFKYYKQRLIFFFLKQNEELLLCRENSGDFQLSFIVSKKIFTNISQINYQMTQ